MADLSGLHRKAQEAIGGAMAVDEEVVLAIPGERGSALVATNRRVFVFKKGITSGSFFSKQVNSWDFINISGVEFKKGMTTQAVVVQVPGAVPVTKFGRFDSGAASVWEAPHALMAEGDKSLIESAVGELRALVAKAQAPVRLPQQATADPIDQVSRLAELRDRGILTTEEFEVKKRQLLGL